MSSTPVREQILAAITAMLSGVWGQFPKNFSALPATHLVDGEDAAAANAYDMIEVTTPLVVARAAQAASTAPDAMRTQGNGLLADLQVEMEQFASANNLVDDIDYQGGSVDQDGKVVFGTALFNVRWHHRRGDPFNIE